MNEDLIYKFANQANYSNLACSYDDLDIIKFAELIVKECIDKIETYQIPIGNSAAGEMASEWTYDALIAIRDDIKEHFGYKI